MTMPLYAESIWSKVTKKEFSKVLHELYGTRTITLTDKLVVKTPKIATNGGAVPISIISEMEAKRVTVFSEKEEEKIIGTFNVPKDGIVDYQLKAKFLLKRSQRIWVVLEDINGNLYTNSSFSEIALSGGCEG